MKKIASLLMTVGRYARRWHEPIPGRGERKKAYRGAHRG